MNSQAAGRHCPLDYRYQPADIARAITHPGLQRLDALWVVGGLYGNLEALDAVLAAYDADPSPRKALVFNGDFHWFDAEPNWFASIQAQVNAHWATRGNVETELARDAIGDAGCGCAYPDWVANEAVAHSNRIIQDLHAAVPPGGRDPLAALPLFLRAEVGEHAVAIVHGDAHSLAGWAFSHEAMQTDTGRDAAAQACTAAGVRAFASSHTCMPVLQGLGQGRWLVNNGAAGMPNAPADLRGLCTRIATTPPPAPAVHQQRDGDWHVSLQAVAYDTARWWQRFAAQWPAGSAAHRAYARRIQHGPGDCG
jgi:hypothetical protein